MTDNEPPAFPSLSESPDESPTRSEPSGPLFSRPAAASEETVVADTRLEPAPAAAAASMTMNSRWRWAAVGVATVLVVGLLGAIFVLAGPRSGAPSTVARYAPADTTTYLELRQDLPGDQHNLLASFMSHFPGFADQAAFDQKFDETLSELFASANVGMNKAMRWQYDIKPWFGGQVGVFSSTISPEPGTPPSITAAFSVKDKAALEQWLTNAGEVQLYEGTAIHTGSSMPGGLNVAATDEVLLAGVRIEDVKAALDAGTNRQPGLADDQFFLQQLAALHGDRLGTLYFDGRAAAESLRGEIDQLGQGVPPELLNWIFDSSSVRVLGEIRAESDHLAITTRTERPANADLPPLPANRTTNLAELAPNDTLVYAEMRDLGQGIGFAIEHLLAPAASAGGAPFDLSSLQTLLGAPPQDFFDFVVDAAVSISISNGEPDFGLIASVDDNVIAQARVDKLVALLHTLTQFGGGVTFDEEQHGAATITVITLSGPLGDSSDVSAAISLTGGRLLIGTRDFVVGALDRTRDQSLAARPEYQAALQAGGTANAGVVFVDIAAALTAFEDMVPVDLPDRYEREQKPFLEPLSHLAVVSTTDGGLMVNHVFLYVK